MHLKEIATLESVSREQCRTYWSRGGGGGGSLRYIGGCIRSLSNFKDTPKALISGQKSTLILIKTLTFSSK